MQLAQTLGTVARTIAAAAVLSVITFSADAAPAVRPLVDTEWLAKHLNRGDVAVLDIRSEFNGYTKDDYLAGHIPGAVWSPYEGEWRTERDGVTGVIPPIEDLESYISSLGISNNTAVVVVPAGVSSSDFGAAARIYWTFRELGHDAVAILDGGHAAWVADNGDLEPGEVTPAARGFVARPDENLLVTTEEVAARIGSDAVLLDARPTPFFEGKEKHPAAKLFGRLPGARNVSHDTLYDPETNRLRPAEELASIVSGQVADKKDVEIVSYCNTAHWAATNWFVLSELLGYKNVSLYDDSMVGWTLDANRPIESERTRLDDLKDWIKGITG